MVSKHPSCYCKLLMWPSGLKFLRTLFHTSIYVSYMHNNYCHLRATAHWQFNILLLLLFGTTKKLLHVVAQWLGHCATNRKVTGSIPDGGFFR
jgi:hypothetical protein